LEAHDRFLMGHSERVAARAVSIAGLLGLDQAAVGTIRLGALLRDIGNAKLPPPIVHKAGELTAHERESLEQHPLLGEELLRRVALRGADDIDVVAVAHDVRSAIAALDEARPDVVLADYHLPDGTGADLARAVRSSPRQTAIVVLTGDPSAFTLADVARSGA